MFLGFHTMLRRAGLKVGVGEWLAVIDALDRGLEGASLERFYRVCRSIVCRDERDFDRYDQAFAAFFKGVALQTPERRALADWLNDPRLRPLLTPEELEKLERYDLETLKRMLEERLAEQKGRHEGGSYWIGTGGTSPLGQGGSHPTGLRIGEGAKGQGQALAAARARVFRNHRDDVILDTRQIATALRRLRRLERKSRRTELDIEETIRATADNGGDIEVVERPERRNQARVVLMMDSGGSMDPYGQTVSRLLSAMKKHGGLREVESWHFHNCVYADVFKNMLYGEKTPLERVVQRRDAHTFLICVGDAWMAPGELHAPYGSIEMATQDPVPGIERLEWLAAQFPRAVWLNPLPERFWHSQTIRDVAAVMPMYPLTVSGIVDAVGLLMGRKRQPPPKPAAMWPGAHDAWLA